MNLMDDYSASFVNCIQCAQYLRNQQSGLLCTLSKRPKRSANNPSSVPMPHFNFGGARQAKSWSQV